MSFGDKIKTLRRQSNYTQEKLAELLSISPQAVSRWETDVAMPDISLLPPIANLFGVSTDYLLGMDSYQKDLRKAEFDKAFFEYWKHDDKENNYQIALKAASEYPGNMDYIEWLASAEYYVALLKNDVTEYNNLLEKSVAHYNIVLDNAEADKLINKALHGIVLSLCMLNRKEEAKQSHSNANTTGWITFSSIWYRFTLTETYTPLRNYTRNSIGETEESLSPISFQR